MKYGALYEDDISEVSSSTSSSSSSSSIVDEIKLVDIEESAKYSSFDEDMHGIATSFNASNNDGALSSSPSSALHLDALIMEIDKIISVFPNEPNSYWSKLQSCGESYKGQWEADYPHGIGLMIYDDRSVIWNLIITYLIFS
jgi:hypothetical protein